MMSESTALETNVRVFTRVRPLLQKEKLNAEDSCVRVTSDQKQVIVGKDRGFTFDGVFNQASSQESVYMHCVEDLVKNIFDGYNSTIFAYGQTGSGKTYTMGTFNQYELLNDEKGIVPRAVEHIFKIISEKKTEVSITVTASFIEVYKEEVRDLLDPTGCGGQDGSNIQIREDDRGNTVLCGVYEHQCESQEELLECLDLGSANRVTGVTLMNEHSSRSHCVFTVNVMQEWNSPCVDLNDELSEYSQSDGKNEIRNVILGKFHFVDLAGSERAHKTGNVGDRFKESIHINSGLLALGNVISALGDPKKKKLSHIPYRESKITRILKDSLGGNARTLMICCISPAVSNYDETVNALKYANRARNIRNKPIVNRDHTTRQIVQMQSEIIALREQLSRQKGDIPQQDERMIGEGVPSQMSDKALMNSKFQMAKFQSIFMKAKDIISCQIDLLCKGNNDISYDLLTRIEEWVQMSEDADFSELEQGMPLYSDMTYVADNRGSISLIKDNLTKLRNDLVNNVDMHAHKFNELQAKDKSILDLENQRCEMKREINSLLVKLREYESRLVEQHRELTQSRRELRKIQQSQQNATNINMQYNFSAAPQSSPIKDQDSCTRIKSVPLSVTKDKRIQSSKANQGDIIVQRKIKSSPHVINPELMVSRFHAQSQFLMSELENEDEVLRPQFEETSGEKKLIRYDEEIPDRNLNIFSRQSSKSSAVDNVLKEETKITSTERLDDAFHAIDIYKKQIKISQLKLTDANQKLRDLSINIRLKEQLINDLVKSAKDTCKVNKTHEVTIKNLEIEKDETSREVEKLQVKLDELSTKSKDNETIEMKKIKEDYQRRMEQAQRKLSELQRKQKETEKLASVTSNHDKKVNDLMITVERSKQEQINMQKKLKIETDIKQKLEKDLQRDQERIKLLEIQNEQQQKVLKRKQEEIAAANRKLRRASTTMSSNENINKPEDQKKWLDEELEKVIQHRKQVQNLELDLKKREEILNKREQLLAERSQICSVSSKSHQSSSCLNKEEKKTTLTVERDNLMAKKQVFEEKVKSGTILSEKEERWVNELDEAIEALDEAIQYKNETIQSKQEECRRSQICTMMSREEIFSRLTQVDAEDSRQLLMRYFDKVIELRESLRQKELLECEKEIQIEELQRIKDQLQRNIERQAIEYDRRYTQLQTNLESEKQVLLHQIVSDPSLATSENSNLERELVEIKDKCQNWEKEAYMYKKTCREMKSKIRDWVLSGRLKADIDLGEVSLIPVLNNNKGASQGDLKERISNTPDSRLVQSKASISVMSISNELPPQKTYDPENYSGSRPGTGSVKSSQVQSARNNPIFKKSPAFSTADKLISGINVKPSNLNKLQSANKRISDRSPPDSISMSIADSLDEHK